MIKLANFYFRFLQFRTSAIVAGVLFLSTSHLAAQPTPHICLDKRAEIESQNIASSPRDFDRLTNSRQMYKFHISSKELFEGECAAYPHAANYIRADEAQLSAYARICSEAGAGSDCSVGPSERYRPGQSVKALSTLNISSSAKAQADRDRASAEARVRAAAQARDLAAAAQARDAARSVSRPAAPETGCGTAEERRSGMKGGSGQNCWAR